jgi:hypothetical protein
MTPITKFSLARALVLGWNQDLNLAVVLLVAAAVPPDTRLSPEEWDSLKAEAVVLYPRCFSFWTILRQSSRTFVAAHWPQANDCLWAGRPNAGHNVIVRSAGVSGGSVLLSDGDRKEIAKDKRAAKGRVTISARSLTKAHDWATCK